MFIEERHQEILNLIEQNRRVSIGEIQEIFGVSVDSARRDLRILEEKGLLKRTHGGAIPMMKVGVPMPEKRSLRDITVVSENYDAISKRAVDYIKSGDTVYITSGSVGYFMTKHLKEDVKFTLVTNSIILADDLKYNDNVDIYLVGGRMRRKGTVVDSFATEFVRNMHFDVSFMTGAGFSVDFGLSNGTHETAIFQQTIIKNSRKNIALFPNLKIGFNGFIKVAEVETFDLLITDWDAFEEELDRIREKGVEVEVVQKEGK